MRTMMMLFAATTALAGSAGDGLERGKCDNGPGAAGADSYFVGKLAISDTEVKGTETWVLFANQKWKALEGADCELEWAIEGKKGTDVGMCVDCDFSLSLSATPQAASSSCPEELVLGRKAKHSDERVGGEAKPWTETYAVKVEGDKAYVYFAESARKISTGTFTDGTLSYVTNHQCKWF
jgi:hypothetical protein